MHDDGKPAWEKFFDKLGAYFNRHFGPDWKEKDRFFQEFEESLNESKKETKRMKKKKMIETLSGMSTDELKRRENELKRKIFEKRQQEVGRKGMPVEKNHLFKEFDILLKLKHLGFSGITN